MKNLAAIVLMLTSFSCSMVMGSQAAPLKQTDQETVTELVAKFPKLKEAILEVADIKFEEYRDLHNDDMLEYCSFFDLLAGYFNGKEKTGNVEKIKKTLNSLQQWLENAPTKSLNQYERLKSLKRIVDVWGETENCALIDLPLLQEIQDLSDSTTAHQAQKTYKLSPEETKLEYGAALNVCSQFFNLDKIEELTIGITYFDPKKNDLEWHVRTVCDPKLFTSLRKLTFYIIYHRQEFWGAYDDSGKVKTNILTQFACLKGIIPTLKDICFEGCLDQDD
ncbi:hypothetical protein [Candidatus Finniella inopinata]|uniref:Uncharacterized protein n=1 Tax=Candidatus Finniella inopinata TaxID=1696036 RepID=A0A4Q7DHZ3_9PROT|nr:hypothetical protein [Candidatus Finniella inopinata]RZI45928.1 hypothetical protein EQU50_05715 [Candidatus Finniella inopinata]